MSGEEEDYTVKQNYPNMPSWCCRRIDEHSAELRRLDRAIIKIESENSAKIEILTSAFNSSVATMNRIEENIMKSIRELNTRVGKWEEEVKEKEKKESTEKDEEVRRLKTELRDRLVIGSGSGVGGIAIWEVMKVIMGG